MKTLPILALLFLPASALAQEVKPPPPKPAPVSTAQPAKPEVKTEPTPEERVAKIKRDIAKLQKELAEIREMEKSGGVAKRVKTFLKERQLAVTEVTGQVNAPVTTKKTGARLLGDAEKAGLAPDVIFTVDSLPVTQAEFDAAYGYLKSRPHEGSDDALKTRAILELIRVKASRAALESQDGAARTKIMAARRRLDQEGADFAALASELSDGPRAKGGGDLGYFGHGGTEFAVACAAFGLGLGETSDVVESQIGYHIVKVTGVENSDDPTNARVRASHIVALYSKQQAARAQAMMRVNNGQVEVAFVSDDYRKLAPETLR